jgi:ABC-type Fe3+ transport system permease subunit
VRAASTARKRPLHQGVVAIGLAGLLAWPVPALAGDPPQRKVSTRSFELQSMRNRDMVIAGTVLTVTSVAAYLVLAAGLVIGLNARDDLKAIDKGHDPDRYDEISQRGKIGNTIAISGGVTAAVTMAVGLPLIIVGRRRQARLLEKAKASAMLLPGGGGVALRVRF